MSRPRALIRRILPLGMVAILLSACQQVEDGSVGEPNIAKPVVSERPSPEPGAPVAPEPSPPRPMLPAPAPAKPAVAATRPGGVAIAGVLGNTTSTNVNAAVSQSVGQAVGTIGQSTSATVGNSAGVGKLSKPEAAITVTELPAQPAPRQPPVAVEVVDSPLLESAAPDPAARAAADAEAQREAQDQLASLQEAEQAAPVEEVIVQEAAPDEVAAAEPAPIPQFPWPPPRASASAVIPAAFVRPSGVEAPTLGEVADEISAALDAGGYFERSYFGAPGGFAMVTRLERINPDGTPKDEAERWTVGALPLSRFSLTDYLRALFTAPSGHYRIIVFVVSSQPFAQSETEVGRSEALAWLSEGLNRLPDNIALAPYTERHTVTALIYEFEQPGNQEAMLMLPANLMGRVHLERAHLWDALRQ